MSKMRPPSPIATSYFDGDRPVPQPVQVQYVVQQGVLKILLADGDVVEWPAHEVRELQDTAGKDCMMLRWTADPIARLLVYGDDMQLVEHLPELKRAAPPKGRGRLALWAGGAVAAVALQIGVLIPLMADSLATYIPPEGERALGEATFGHIRSALDETGLNPVGTCEEPNGLAALERLVDRLAVENELGHELTISVLDHEMVNAFALPGGFVVLFRGLIDAAETPDEVTAVVAHELGHVVSRDPTRHALRSAGSIGVLGLLLGDFAGGAVVLVITEQLISAQYSQGAEVAADAFAHKTLEAANINPGAIGDMFEHMRKKYGDAEGLTAHFLSHPTLGERIKASYAAVNPNSNYTPSMSDEDWESLQQICGYRWSDNLLPDVDAEDSSDAPAEDSDVSEGND